jgi:hypothetical protein
VLHQAGELLQVREHSSCHHILEEVHGVGPSQGGAVVATVWQEEGEMGVVRAMVAGRGSGWHRSRDGR